MKRKSLVIALLCLLFPYILQAQKKNYDNLIVTGSQLMLSPSLDDAQKILNAEGFKKESADRQSLRMDSKMSYVMLFDTPKTKAPIDSVVFMLKKLPAMTELDGLCNDAKVMGFESMDVNDRTMRLMARESNAHETVLVMFPMNDEETKYVVLFTTRQCYEMKYGVIKKEGKAYFKVSQEKGDRQKGFRFSPVEKGKKAPQRVNPSQKGSATPPQRKSETPTTKSGKPKARIDQPSKSSIDKANQVWQAVSGTDGTTSQIGPLEWETVTVEKNESFQHGDTYIQKYTVNLPIATGEGSNALNATILKWLAGLMLVDPGQLNAAHPREAVAQLLERSYLQTKSNIQQNTPAVTGEMSFSAENYTITLTRGLNDLLVYDALVTTYQEGIHQDVRRFALMADPATGRKLAFYDVFKVGTLTEVGELVSKDYNKKIAGSGLEPAYPQMFSDNFMLLDDKVIFISNICDGECEPVEFSYGYKKLGKYLKD